MAAHVPILQTQEAEGVAARRFLLHLPALGIVTRPTFAATCVRAEDNAAIAEAEGAKAKQR